MLAISVIFEQFIFTTQYLKVTLSTYSKVIVSIMFGPAAGGLVYALTDILSVITNPKGPYFPGFTFSAMLAGIIYGVSFYKKRANLPRVAFTVAIVNLVCSVTLNTTWLVMMYNLQLNVIFVPRVILALSSTVVETALIFALYKSLSKLEIIKR